MRILISILKKINIVLIILFLFLLSFNETDEQIIQLNSQCWILCFLVPPFVINIIISRINRKYEFFEWIRKERIKKNMFTSSLYVCITFSTYLSFFLLVSSIYAFDKIDLSMVNKIDLIFPVLDFFYGILFMINSLFMVQLHTYFFDDNLPSSIRYIDNKPKNWDTISQYD